MSCLICASRTRLLFKSANPIAVTSDCHAVEGDIQIYQCDSCMTIQKNADATFLTVLKQIYANYRIYVVSGGHEQVKFADGVPKARSELIIENISPYIPRSGEFLDVGTGSGVFLKALHKLFSPHVTLHAQDIHRNEEERILAIPSVKQFFCGNIFDIEGKFDAISMIHVLEHILNPLELLSHLRKLLKPSGVLIIQIPNIEENPFDAVVYDHVYHFTRQTAAQLMSKVFPVCALPDKQINNEITLLAGTDEKYFKNNVEGVVSSCRIAFEQINVVSRFLRKIGEEMAVFGVSPTGTFCGATLGDKLACFVDEDVSIQHRKHLNKEILPPSEVRRGLKIFLPTNKNRALIRERLHYLNFVTEDDI